MSDEGLGPLQIRPHPNPLPAGEGNGFPLSIFDGEEGSPWRRGSGGRTRSEATVPIDHQDRLRLRSEFGRTFFVEAGAGTGKTTELVARIVALVEAGQVSMEKLAAITFTEAAAAELRERVRRGLEKAAAEPSHDETARDRCRRAARDVDLATIQTIHAFAGTLLRTFPIEAGLPPGFDVWDEIQSDLAFDERFRTWLYDEVPSNRPEDLPRHDSVRRALLLGMTFEHLHDLAKALQEQADLLDRTTTWSAPQPADALTVARRWGEEIQSLRKFICLAKHGEDDKLARHVLDLQFAATRLANARDQTDALLALQAIGNPYTRDGSQKDWERTDSGVNACKLIKDCLQCAKDEIAQTLLEHRSAVLATLLGYLRDFTLDYARQRHQQGAATFHDLLTWARDLLRDNLEIRAQAQRRFDRIFVDEFQDTDPLQAEIVWFLAADPNVPPPKDWRQVRLVPGKLFIVGDPKQSIYRFRRADIALYARIYEQAATDERASLVQNFRSVPPVLRWVNYHFRHDMQSESGVQATYVDLQPSSLETEPNGARWGVYRIGDRLDGNVGAIRATEADVVSRIAHQVIADGWLVRDSDGGLRRARYADVCVLMPSRRNVRGLEDAFERHGVPYRMESGSLVLATQEVRDLLACLRAIDDPSDQVALVAALRSPAYACSDVDLLRWVEGGGKLDYEQPGDGPDGPVAEALVSLRRFHVARASRSPAATIDAFVRERMLAVQSFGQPRPREAWRRLRYVVAQARLFAAAGRTTLRALVDWLEGLQRIAVRDTESPLPEADEDAVRLLTIHGAKGLEFPIVILIGLGDKETARTPTVHLLADRQNGALQVRCGDFQTEGYEVAKKNEALMEGAERIRLLYVAATRARDHLVLCLYHGKYECHASRIAKVLENSGEPLCHALTVDEADSATVSESPSAGDETVPTPDHHAADEQQWQNARRAMIEDLSSAPLLTATNLARRTGSSSAHQGVAAQTSFASEAADATLAANGSPSPGNDVVATAGLLVDEDAGPSDIFDANATTLAIEANTATALGKAVHAVLETMRYPAASVPDAVVESAARRFGVPGRVEEVKRLVEAVSTSPAIRDVVASGHLWREVPVGVEIDGIVLEGRIDLVGELADGSLTVVDVKTDKVDRETVAARADRYRLQGGAYALALEQATGKKVNSIAFVFAALDGHVEVYRDVPALVAETREHLRRTCR